MAVGALHNFFSEMGCEIEEGRPGARQQDGLQWPAIYRAQDSQAAKGLWIGATNFTDEIGAPYSHKVVHVGPRVNGIGEFFPTRFEVYSKFEPPKVYVDGVLSYGKPIAHDIVDPDLAADRMIINVTNTQLGITMERKILAFSQQNHENYMIYEYTFTNTGNVDADPQIELADNIVENIYAYFQYRYAPCFNTRGAIGNDSGWGINTMNNARGDGAANIAQYNDPPEERFRAQYSWHGYWSNRKSQEYDNIGGPIWIPDSYYVQNGWMADYDTLGRIGAPQFVGVVTLYADDPANIGTDDINQPSTTNYIYSNEPRITFQNNAYNESWNEEEYTLFMSSGHSQRHAWVAEPSGNFAEQTSEIPNDAGFSFGNGYGPYTLARGDSFRIVMAEGAAGLSTERCIDIGKQYKRGEIDAVTKNVAVLTGKDSLFKTFRQAIDNFETGYGIEQPPKPAKTFSVESGGDRITLTWDLYDDINLAGFRIYRTEGEYDNPFQREKLIYEAGRTETSFNDLSPIRGVGYYYYIVSVGQNGLVSNQYYTQSYDPAFLKRPAGEDLSSVRVVPNPYVISSSPDRLRFGRSEPDKLAFFNIPGQCTIRIYTEIGELIHTIEHTDGSGDEYWKATTSSNQVVVSGVYIAVVTDHVTGKQEVVKFVIIR
jgi:hypothetical protein